MNATRILAAVDAAGLPLPGAVEKLRTALYAISEYDVAPRPLPTAQELGRRVLDETLRTGEVPDILQMVAESRANADSVLAYAAMEAVGESGAGRLENLVRASVPALLTSVRERIQQVLVEVGNLPAATPTQPLDAVNGTPRGIEAFKKLQGAQEQYARLKAVHLACMEGSEPQAALAFTDTRLIPSTNDGRTYIAAGPRDPLARLRWLSSPASESWVPSSAELVARYSEWRQQVSQEGAGQRPTPAKAG